MHKKEIVKYVNPEQFKIYKNNTIRLGNICFSPCRDMFVVTTSYIKELLSSTHIAWGFETQFFGDVFVKHYEKMNAISDTAYENPLQIRLNISESQMIYVNEHVIKVAYRSGRGKHQLLKDRKLVEESDSLLELFEKAKTL